MIIENKVDYKQHSEMPFTDSLTGLFHHGFFLNVLAREIKRSLRYRESLSLALIEIDAFSVYNKQHGPLQADRDLKEVASIISKCIRDVDLAARFGGDIFAVILTEVDASSSIKALERIQTSLRERYSGALTVGIGAANCPEDADNMDDLISRAWDALNRAKIKGRDMLFFFPRAEVIAKTDEPRVLVVDDNPVNVKILEAMLKPFKYVVSKAFSGLEALTMIEREDIDLVLLDIVMPGIDGIEVCRRIKRGEQTRIIPVVMVTSLDEIEAKVQSIEAGADDFISKPINKLELLARTRSLIAVKRLNENMIGFENALISLANAVEAKDVYTQGHIKRVSSMAILLGKRMSLSSREVEALRIGGILHDIGKIGIPDAILKKAGTLDPDEWEMMKRHPEMGYQVVYPLKRTLQQALDIIRYHHERMDGSGYPDGLKGEAICMVARIMAVADYYDALITDRPYRKALAQEDVLRLMRQEAIEGKLDEQVVDTLITILNNPPQEEEPVASEMFGRENNDPSSTDTHTLWKDSSIAVRDMCATVSVAEPVPAIKPEILPIQPMSELDMAEGLARLNGNRELYLRLLSDFIAGNRDMPARVQQELRANRLHKAVELVHAIRGVAGNLGGKKLEAAAGELEKVCRAAGNFAPFAPGEPLRKFIEHHEALIIAINNVIAKECVISPVKSENPSGNVAELYPLLEQMKKALANDEPRPCKQILGTLLQKKWPGDMEAALLELNRLVQNYRFGEALTFLSNEFDNIVEKTNEKTNEKTKVNSAGGR
ncbi:MAG: Sensor histidine kinase RcsC [Syntrophus sp. SKADARSKE-3]|nr:Sensor histidine kinase RcsC [Syntrophus sp. SKADARSKE-3]